MRLAVAALAVVVVSGCQTKQISEMSYSEIKETAAQIEKRCTDQGFPRGSKEFDPCIRQEVEREDAMRRSARARGQQFAAGLAQASQNYNQSIQANRQFNCRSTSFGNTVSTSCY